MPLWSIMISNMGDGTDDEVVLLVWKILLRTRSWFFFCCYSISKHHFTHPTFRKTSTVPYTTYYLISSHFPDFFLICTYYKYMVAWWGRWFSFFVPVSAKILVTLFFFFINFLKFRYSLVNATVCVLIIIKFIIIILE